MILQNNYSKEIGSINFFVAKINGLNLDIVKKRMGGRDIVHTDDQFGIL